MAEIIDAHAHVASDPRFLDRAPFPGDVLVAAMDRPLHIAGGRRRIDRAIAMPTARYTLEVGLSFRDQHAAVIDAVRAFPDRLVGMFMFNPYHGAEAGVAELERLVREERFRAVKLHPTFHGYSPATAAKLLWPILEAAGRLDLGVLIHTGDPPFSYPLLMLPLAKAFPNVRFALAHFGTQRLSLALEAIEVARACDNVWIETSCAHLQHLKEGVRVLGPTRLLFGSDFPFEDQHANARTIDALCGAAPLGIALPDADRERILGENAKDVFGLA